MRKVNEHALRCASRLNEGLLFFFLGGLGFVFILVEILARAGAAAETEDGQHEYEAKDKRDLFH